MAALLNEFTRVEQHANNNIPVGTNMEPMNIHRLTVVVCSADLFSSNKCSNGAATADGWERVMKTKIAISQP
jgi:hypothetical protein